jgi:hypothetical protein
LGWIDPEAVFIGSRMAQRENSKEYEGPTRNLYHAYIVLMKDSHGSMEVREWEWGMGKEDQHKGVEIVDSS